MEIVEVFKTNVQENDQASRLIEELLVHFPSCKINFDLEDCDKVLRMAGKKIHPEKVIEVISSSGYHCEPLS